MNPQIEKRLYTPEEIKTIVPGYRGKPEKFERRIQAPQNKK